MLVAVVLAAVIVLLSAALAITGVLSVGGRLGDVVRAARRVVTTAGATASRYIGQNASIVVEIRGSSEPEFRPGNLLVVYDAGGLDILPASQPVDFDDRTVVQVSATILKPPDRKVNVLITVYQANTMTPIADLMAVVPARNRLKNWLRAARNKIRRRK